MLPRQHLPELVHGNWIIGQILGVKGYRLSASQLPLHYKDIPWKFVESVGGKNFRFSQMCSVKWRWQVATFHPPPSAGKPSHCTMNLGADGLQIDPAFSGKEKHLKGPANGYIEKDTSFKACPTFIPLHSHNHHKRSLQDKVTIVQVWAACGVCGRQSGTGAGFLRVLRFPLPIISPISPLS
jgi:hypothetical protein